MDPRETTRPPTAKLTYSDFVNFPDDGQRHELIDGEHYVTPAPRTAHQRLASRLDVALSNYFAEMPIGESFIAPLDVILSDHDVVEPDVLVVLHDRQNIVQDWIRGAPSIAIEIVSPSSRRRDERLKRDLYERVGVLEYWIVYPERGVIRVARQTKEGLLDTSPELSVAMHESLTSPLLPGFAIELATLFRPPL